MVATLHSSACRSRQQHCLKQQATYLGDMSERVRHLKGRCNSCSTGLQARQTITRRSHRATTSARRSSSSLPSWRSGYAKGVLAVLSSQKSTRGQDRSSRRRSVSTGQALGDLVATSSHEFLSGALLFLRLASDGVLGFGHSYWHRHFGGVSVLVDDVVG